MNRTNTATVVARAVLAGLAGAIAGIHLDLWTSYGYRHIPTIGSLFLLNVVAGAVLAIASLVLPRRVVPLAWLATAGFGIATLAAVIVSLNTTLFGFHETTSAPLLAASIAVEAAAVIAGAAATVWALRPATPVPHSASMTPQATGKSK